jgi:hypothetical protein
MRRRLLAAVSLVAAILLLGAGTGAWAYFTGVGSGTGSGPTGITVPVSLTPGAAGAGLYPGGTADVRLTVTNSNTAQVRIGSLVLDPTRATGGYAVDSGHNDCLLSTLTYSPRSNGGFGWSVPARSGVVVGTLDITLAGALAMSADAANACQGAVFTVYLTAAS